MQPLPRGQHGKLKSLANHYFQFKQFRVNQQGAAMKVCTDACAFGAWVNRAIKDAPIANALDIGTGTGLLSLMLAQENPFQIESIEVDQSAYHQAAENFVQSPWAGRFSLHLADALNWVPAKPYQLIICNPPFFKNDLLSPRLSKQQSKHEAGLTPDKIFSSAKLWLAENGMLALLMPYNRTAEINEVAERYGFTLCRSALLKRNITDSGFRSMLMYCKQKRDIQPLEVFLIKDGSNNYSSVFQQLMAPYYL